MLLCGFYFVIGGPPCQLFLNFYQMVEPETYLQQSG
nr:MAG TPA: Cytosine-specific methyltransferase [Bacteriophage sp.]